MRTTIVSTSKLKTYKTIALSLVSLITLAVVIYATISIFKFKEFHQLLIVPLYIVMAVKAIPAIIKIKNISYDESAVYYDKKGFEVQIPFEDIRDIEIKTISGIYKINLYNPTQDGEYILFKTSLWYPFNFKKQDEKVNELRDKIDSYKRTLPEKTFAGLPSYHL
jgi:hypothetical protein